MTRDTLGYPAPFRASIQGKASPEVSRDTFVTGDTSQEAQIIELAAIRKRVNDGVAYLQRQVSDPMRFDYGKARLEVIADDYRRVMSQVRKHATDAELVERQQALEARLTRGWNVTRPGADKLFAELLTQYEAITDALNNDTMSIIRRVRALEAYAV